MIFHFAEKSDHDNNILPRRPSLVVTSSDGCIDLETGATGSSLMLNGNGSLKPPDTNLSSPTHSFLQAPSFFKVKLKSIDHIYSYIKWYGQLLDSCQSFCLAILMGLQTHIPKIETKV